MASNTFGAIWFFTARLLSYSAATAAVLPRFLGRFARHLQRYEQRRLAASARQMNFRRLHTP
jgi:hypothetical protein